MSDSLRKKYRYSDAGVDTKVGRDFIDLIKPIARATATRGTNSELGGFAALFDTRAAGFTDPILVAATDGVGTKLLIANAVGRHKTIGIDLVAMCVNDLVVQRAKPLFFLDYLATGQLDVKIAIEVVKGIAVGCQEAGCALIGGETAEMPGLYSKGHYDLAGFSVGAVERDQLHTENTIEPGDEILGLASSGVHSNGFSLIRKLISEKQIKLSSKSPFDSEKTLSEILLTPTKIYVSSILNLLDYPDVEIKGIAHITGGGFHENIPRILPKHVSVRLNALNWRLPDVFQWICDLGHIDFDEMARTFNCGIGMILIVKPRQLEQAHRILTESGELVYRIGTVTSRSAENPSVIIENVDRAWSKA